MQMHLPARDGGLSLLSMARLACAAFLAAACTAMRYVAAHHPSLLAAATQPVALGASPYLHLIRSVYAEWRTQLAASTAAPLLSSLLHVRATSDPPLLLHPSTGSRREYMPVTWLH